MTVAEQITQQAQTLGVPSSLALAVAQRESGLNQSAVGSSGELGVFQLMPGTAAGLGVDPSDLGQNIQGGLTYLKSLYTRFGNWYQALEAYNGGPSHVDKGNVSTAAQGYATAVLSASGISDAPSASDLLNTGDLSILSDAFDTLDVGGTTGLSLAAWGALALILIGTVALLRD